MTNLIISFIVIVTTNTFHPKQYKTDDCWMLNETCKIESIWQDTKPRCGGVVLERENTNVLITMVTETKIKKIIDSDGEHFGGIEGRVLRKKRQIRIGNAWVGGWKIYK